MDRPANRKDSPLLSFHLFYLIVNLSEGSMKKCSRCSCLKDHSEFFKSKSAKDGLQTRCKKCTSNSKEYMKRYREDNKEKLKLLNAKWHEANKEYISEYNKQKYQEQRKERRLKGKQHYEENKALYLHYSRFRKALLIQRTPSWLTEEDVERIKCFYKEARRLSEETGVVYHVDHIIPLQGDIVSGFHIPDNLQIITAEENLRKSNKYNEQ